MRTYQDLWGIIQTKNFFTHVWKINEYRLRTVVWKENKSSKYLKQLDLILDIRNDVNYRFNDHFHRINFIITGTVARFYKTILTTGLIWHIHSPICISCVTRHTFSNTLCTYKPFVTISFVHSCVYYPLCEWHHQVMRIVVMMNGWNPWLRCTSNWLQSLWHGHRLVNSTTHSIVLNIFF